jgi:hypothetical protein
MESKRKGDERRGSASYLVFVESARCQELSIATKRYTVVLNAGPLISIDGLKRGVVCHYVNWYNERDRGLDKTTTSTRGSTFDEL